jgi:hypothetical protein
MTKAAVQYAQSSASHRFEGFTPERENPLPSEKPTCRNCESYNFGQSIIEGYTMRARKCHRSAENAFSSWSDRYPQSLDTTHTHDVRVGHTFSPAIGQNSQQRHILLFKEGQDLIIQQIGCHPTHSCGHRAWRRRPWSKYPRRSADRSGQCS